MFHSFSIEIASKYGINEAIILNNFYYWIEKNKANNKHFYDGYYWTYNSMKALSELFPYLSERQLKYSINKMVDEGLIIKGKYNKLAYDRTTWYAITKFGYSIIQNCPFDRTKLSNGLDKIVQPIPNINTNINTNNNIFMENDEIKDKNNHSFIEEYCKEIGLTKKIYESLLLWFDYKKEKKQSYKPTGIKALIKRTKKYYDMYNEEKICDVIESSIASNYQGITFDKLEKSNNNNNIRETVIYEKI